VEIKTALSKNQVERIEKRIAGIEDAIAAEEKVITRSTGEMSDPSVSADGARLKEIGRAIEAAETRILELSSEWETLSLQLETDVE
jgi:hypothetical protein